MKLTWSPQAVENLNQIVDLIALDKKETAHRWARMVEAKVARLSRFPLSGRVVPEVRRDEIREILVGSYRVIYKVEKGVSILTIFHGAKGRISLP